MKSAIDILNEEFSRTVGNVIRYDVDDMEKMFGVNEKQLEQLEDDRKHRIKKLLEAKKQHKVVEQRLSVLPNLIQKVEKAYAAALKQEKKYPSGTPTPYTDDWASVEPALELVKDGYQKFQDVAVDIDFIVKKLNSIKYRVVERPKQTNG